MSDATLTPIRDQILERYPDTDFIFLEPASIDAAIVGVAERLGFGPVVVYDRAKLVKCFMDDGMDDEGAEEWISFNIEGAYLGEATPLLLNSLDSLA